MWLRLKPLAIFCVDRRRSGSRSPASCSTVNWSNGMIRVERVDHPFAPARHVAAGVDVVAVRVGEAGGIEPVDGHPLAVVRRGQQPIDELLVRIRAACR